MSLFNKIAPMSWKLPTLATFIWLNLMRLLFTGDGVKQQIYQLLLGILVGKNKQLKDRKILYNILYRLIK